MKNFKEYLTIRKIAECVCDKGLDLTPFVEKIESDNFEQDQFLLELGPALAAQQPQQPQVAQAQMTQPQQPQVAQPQMAQANQQVTAQRNQVIQQIQGQLKILNQALPQFSQYLQQLLNIK